MNNKVNKFYIASDHAGFDLKEKIKKYLESIDIEVIDLGTTNSNQSVSYAIYGKKLAQSILDHQPSYGIGVCGTGLGISYAVNRFNGIRGARITSIEDAKLAKKHNDANILLFGGRQIKFSKAKKMINAFLNENYEGGRHQSRIDELNK